MQPSNNASKPTSSASTPTALVTPPSFLLPPTMNNMLFTPPAMLYGTIPSQVYSSTPLLYAQQQQQQLAQQQQQQQLKKKKKKKKKSTTQQPNTTQQQTMYQNLLLNTNNFTSLPQPWNSNVTTATATLTNSNNSNKQKSKATATNSNTPTSMGIFNPIAAPSIIPNNMVALPSSSTEKVEDDSNSQEQESGRKRKIKEESSSSEDSEIDEDESKKPRHKQSRYNNHQNHRYNRSMYYPHPYPQPHHQHYGSYPPPPPHFHHPYSTPMHHPAYAYLPPPPPHYSSRHASYPPPSHSYMHYPPMPQYPNSRNQSHRPPHIEKRVRSYPPQETSTKDKILWKNHRRMCEWNHKILLFNTDSNGFTTVTTNSTMFSKSYSPLDRVSSVRSSEQDVVNSSIGNATGDTIPPVEVKKEEMDEQQTENIVKEAEEQDEDENSEQEAPIKKEENTSSEQNHTTDDKKSNELVYRIDQLQYCKPFENSSPIENQTVIDVFCGTNFIVSVLEDGRSVLSITDQSYYDNSSMRSPSNLFKMVRGRYVLVEPHSSHQLHYYLRLKPRSLNHESTSLQQQSQQKTKEEKDKEIGQLFDRVFGYSDDDITKLVFRVKDSKKLVIIGSNKNSEMGYTKRDFLEYPSFFGLDEPFESVYCSKYDHIYLSADRKTVYGAGEHFSSNGNLFQKLVIPLEGDEFIAKITGGLLHFAVLTSKGRLYMCGKSSEGQIPHKESTNPFQYFQKAPSQIDLFDGLKIIDVACGRSHSLFLDEQRHVWVCGTNQMNELGLTHLSGSSSHSSVPLKLVTTSNLEFTCDRIFAGFYFSLFIVHPKREEEERSDGAIYWSGKFPTDKCLEFGYGNRRKTMLFQKRALTQLELKTNYLQKYGSWNFKSATIGAHSFSFLFQKRNTSLATLFDTLQQHSQKQQFVDCEIFC